MSIEISKNLTEKELLEYTFNRLGITFYEEDDELSIDMHGGYVNSCGVGYMCFHFSKDGNFLALEVSE